MTHSAMTKYQRQPDNNVTLKTVPKVRLYVERPEEEKWFVNIGHVTERGRWKTEPHAHPEYGQVNFVRSGRGVMNLEGSSVPFEGPCVLLLPTECVHGLDYEIDADRWVVTIEVSYLTQVNARLHEFIQLWSAPRMIPLPSTAGIATEFFGLITRLAQELESKNIGHVVGTEALLTSLFLMLVRGTQLDQIDNGGATRNEIRLADRFRELIDQHYRQNLPLREYASMMAVSLVQLRAACASATGQSPTKMIHARIVTEAKRNLIFGEMSVEQIAFGLGFSDAAYFTRFFRKEVGEAPSQFRSNARDQAQKSK
ncbi:MAG: helix-turn-helix domain-containing protein [Paraburkholderia sp.]|uniref:helix-turn-helix domain-containing protein n=1 Tax=Paraburkholderia TaxID=1822464 RepID=UPI0019141D1A|nr:helix-turn-helix domain-containing protein [Paraburkholderia domus]MBK5053318.1 helix-turn-helix domain-containing protein [Burkholderia sp. R-70006]CAE6823917.1 HTH-type transcriptional activator RhaS [Paraburkholderia domus]CAE6834802.1 HTH-type transcriptional activator RhaS [Paraburkholderia domus]